MLRRRALGPRRRSTTASADELPPTTAGASRRWTQNDPASRSATCARTSSSPPATRSRSTSRAWTTIPTLRRALRRAGRTLRRGDAYTATSTRRSPTESQRRARGRRLPRRRCTRLHDAPRPAPPGAPGATRSIDVPVLRHQRRARRARRRAAREHGQRASCAARGLGPHLRARPAPARGREDARRLRPARARPTSRQPSSPTPRRRRRRARPSTASCSTPSRATASSSRARWRCCCGWAASPRASPPASRTGATDPKTRRVRRARLRRALVGRGLLPGYGWVTFDPTPADSPAAQPAAGRGSTGGGHPARQRGSTGDDPVTERGAGAAGRRPGAPVVA